MVKSRVKKMLLNKQIVLALLVMIVVTAGIINWAGKRAEEAVETGGNVDYTENIPAPTVATSIDYFSQVIADRDNVRSQSIDVLEGVVNNSQATQQQKDQASEDIRTVAKDMQTEATIEGLIKAKGFENAVVYISDGGASVIVKAKGLTATQVAQIKDIVTGQASISGDKIRISEVGGE